MGSTIPWVHVLVRVGTEVGPSVSIFSACLWLTRHLYYSPLGFPAGMDCDGDCNYSNPFSPKLLFVGVLCHRDRKGCRTVYLTSQEHGFPQGFQHQAWVPFCGVGLTSSHREVVYFHVVMLCVHVSMSTHMLMNSGTGAEWPMVHSLIWCVFIELWRPDVIASVHLALI